MVEIIPTINAPDWATARERIIRIAPYTEWVEIDISDGKFTKTATWNKPDDLKSLETEKHVRVAVHLMVYDPENVVSEWIKTGARRIIVQYEGIRDKVFGRSKKIRQLADICKENWVEFGISITPRTDVDDIKSYLPLAQVIQVLAVEPGPSGQEARPEALAMVSQLRTLKGGFKIEWDGGVRLTNIRDIKNAGADLIAAASAIFGSSEPEKSLEALKKELLG